MFNIVLVLYPCSTLRSAHKFFTIRLLFATYSFNLFQCARALRVFFSHSLFVSLSLSQSRNHCIGKLPTNFKLQRQNVYIAMWKRKESWRAIIFFLLRFCYCYSSREPCEKNWALMLTLQIKMNRKKRSKHKKKPENQNICDESIWALVLFYAIFTNV